MKKIFTYLLLSLFAVGSTFAQCYDCDHHLPVTNINVITVNKTNGHILVGTTANNAYEWDGSNWTQFAVPSPNIKAIVVDDSGEIWFGCFPGGVYKYNNGNYDPQTGMLINNFILGGTLDLDGNVWMISSGQGINKWDGTAWTKFDAVDFPNGTNFKSVNGSHCDNSIWIGTIAQGLYQFKNDQVWNHFTSTDHASLAYDIPDVAVDVNCDIWIATAQGGLLQYNGTSWTVHDASNFGWGIDFMASIEVDASNTKWVGVDFGGIIRYDGATKRLINTNDQDCIFSNEPNAATTDMDGNKFYGTTNGVSEISDHGAPCINCGKPIISGVVFNDINGDGIKDANEDPIPYHVVKVEPGPVYLTTDDNGQYFAYDVPGTYTVSAVPQPWWTSTNTPSVTTTSTDIVSYNNDLGVKIRADNVTDVGVTVTGGIPDCRFDHPYFVNYKNWGTTTESGEVKFTFNNNILTYKSASPTPDNASGNELSWNYSNLAPGDQELITITFSKTGNGANNQYVHLTASISGSGVDSNMVNNNSNFDDQVKCGNNVNVYRKTVSPDGIMGDYVSDEAAQNYSVYFLNRTNSPEAENVFVCDNLDANLDPGTFIMNGEFHETRYSIQNNIVRFYMEGVNLPDSGANHINTHAFSVFGVKPKAGVAHDTDICNDAEVALGVSEGKMTNQTCNTICDHWPKAGFNVNIDGLTVVVLDMSNDATSWDWTFGDGGTSTGANTGHDYTADGTYDITLTVTNDCGIDSFVQTITVTAQDTTGINERIADDLISVLPNPNDGNFFITVNMPDSKTMQLKLYDVTGNEVWNETGGYQNGVYQKAISLENYAKGVYFLQVVTDQGSYNKKVVLQ